jgi:hypothetical protein
MPVKHFVHEGTSVAICVGLGVAIVPGERLYNLSCLHYPNVNRFSTKTSDLQHFPWNGRIRAYLLTKSHAFFQSRLQITLGDGQNDIISISFTSHDVSWMCAEMAVCNLQGFMRGVGPRLRFLRHLRQLRQAKLEAVAMGLHPRLGAEMGIERMDDILFLVAEFPLI